MASEKENSVHAPRLDGFNETAKRGLAVLTLCGWAPRAGEHVHIDPKLAVITCESCQSVLRRKPQIANVLLAKLAEAS